MSGPIGVPAALRDAHARAFRSRGDVERATACRCFYCLKGFLPEHITEWVDNNETPLCPECGVDSVLSDTFAPVADDDFARRMHDAYFTKGTVIDDVP